MCDGMLLAFGNASNSELSSTVCLLHLRFAASQPACTVLGWHGGPFDPILFYQYPSRCT